jgi:hypothetical protein
MTDPTKKPVTLVAPGQITESNMDAVLAHAASTGDLGQAQFSALLQLMMAKERRLVVKEAELAQREAERDEKDRAASTQLTATMIEAQKNCRHLKGGRTRARGNQKDYNVYSHRYANGVVVIKCNDCGAKWGQKDTDEYLYRHGDAIPNWTGIGWRRAVEMCEESSNKPSASELAQAKGYVVPTAGGRAVQSTSGETDDIAAKVAKVKNLQL